MFNYNNPPDAKTLTEAKVAELKQKYGSELMAVDVPELGVMVFHKAKREDYDRWQDKNLVSKANASQDGRELCQACLVDECTYEDLKACLDAKPGLLQGEFLGCILKMAGTTEAYPVKKL